MEVTSWGWRLPDELSLCSSACWCTDVTSWSNHPGKWEATVTSILLWDAVFPVCGQSWADIRGRRRERIAELGKNMMFCWCLQDPRQMVSHRWMLWAGRSATTAIALVAGSLPQLTVWPGHPYLSLSLSFFTDLSQSGQLWTARNTSACWLQYSQSQDGWKAECKMERKGRWWKRSFERRGDRRTAYFWVLANAVDVIGNGSSGDLMELLWFFRSKKAFVTRVVQMQAGPCPFYKSSFPPPSTCLFFFLLLLFLRMQKGRQTHPFIILSHYFWCIF